MTATVIQMPAPKTMAEKLGVEVGTVFYRSWGYDQTNVNFYQVVGITPSGKSVRLREIGKRAVSSPRSGVVAVKDHFIDDEVFTKLLQTSYDGKSAYTAFNSYSSLSVADGTPQYDTCALGYTGH